jgi:hypothetical protein
MTTDQPSEGKTGAVAIIAKHDPGAVITHEARRIQVEFTQSLRARNALAALRDSGYSVSSTDCGGQWSCTVSNLKAVQGE